MFWEKQLIKSTPSLILCRIFDLAMIIDFFYGNTNKQNCRYCTKENKKLICGLVFMEMSLFVLLFIEENLTGDLYLITLEETIGRLITIDLETQIDAEGYLVLT